MPGLRYSLAEGGLISVIIPDDERELDAINPQPGEGILIVSPGDYARATNGDLRQGHAGLQALVSAATGKEAPDPRHAVVDKQTGDVIDVILAYPSVLPLAERYELRSSGKAVKGDRYVGQGKADDDIERVIAEKAAEEAAKAGPE